MNIFPRKKIPAFFWPISFFVFLLPLFSPKAVLGIDNCEVSFSPGFFMSENTLSLYHSSIQEGYKYRIITPSGQHPQIVAENIIAKDGGVTITISPDKFLDLKLFGETQVDFQLFPNDENRAIICQSTVTISPGGCQWSSSPPNPTINEEVTITVSSPSWPEGLSSFYIQWIDENGTPHNFTKNERSGKFTPTAAVNYRFYLYKQRLFIFGDDLICGTFVNVGDAETPGEGITEPPSLGPGQYNICQDNHDCLNCFDEGKAWTALGCIPTEPMDLVKWLFPYLLGFGGLAAFGLIVYSGFRLMTSSGDPQKIQGARETITSAVTGLIFIILSLFLLRLIGVNLLGLPGLE